MSEFVVAAEMASELDRYEIRARAQSLYSTDVVRQLYDLYFRRISAQVWGGEWYI